MQNKMKKLTITASYNKGGGIDVSTKQTEMSAVEILAAIAVIQHEINRLTQFLINKHLDK